MSKPANANSKSNSRSQSNSANSNFYLGNTPQITYKNGKVMVGENIISNNNNNNNNNSNNNNSNNNSNNNANNNNNNSNNNNNNNNNNKPVYFLPKINSNNNNYNSKSNKSNNSIGGGNNNTNSKSNNSANEASADSAWAIIDVIGDGNCFYRSLYNAARFSHDSRAFQRLLECFGMNESDYNNIDTNNLDKYTDLEEFVLINHELPREKDFSDAIREKIAEKIRGSLLEDMGDSATNTLLKGFAEAGALKEAVKEFSGTFRKEFKKLSAIPGMSRNDFKEKFAKVIATDCAYVSELEINVINFVLEPCGIKVVALNPEDTSRIDISDYIIPLFVYRTGEHYNFVVQWHIYQKYFNLLDELGNGELDIKSDVELFMNHEDVRTLVLHGDVIQSSKGPVNASSPTNGGRRRRSSKATKRRSRAANKTRRRK